MLGAVQASMLGITRGVGGHRYWRILSTGNSWNTSSGTALAAFYTISFYSSFDATGTDLCLTRSSTSESYFNGFYDALRANDGNNTTYHMPRSGASNTPSPQWWMCDMVSNVEVHSIYIICFARYIWSSFKLQYSDNNINWFDAGTLTTSDGPATFTFTNI